MIDPIKLKKLISQWKHCRAFDVWFTKNVSARIKKLSWFRRALLGLFNICRNLPNNSKIITPFLRLFLPLPYPQWAQILQWPFPRGQSKTWWSSIWYRLCRQSSCCSFEQICWGQRSLFLFQSPQTVFALPKKFNDVLSEGAHVGAPLQ